MSKRHAKQEQISGLESVDMMEFKAPRFSDSNGRRRSRSAGNGYEERKAVQPTQKATIESKDASGDLASNGPYKATKTGMVWLKPFNGKSVPVPLTNFSARVVEDIALDDGVELGRAFEIEAVLNGAATRFNVPADQFSRMDWVTEHLGASAVIYAGSGKRDHARAAVQLLSGDIRQRRVFTHLGWRNVNGRWVYLHAGGAIGACGTVEGVEVSLPEPLDRFALQAPPTGIPLALAVRASLRFLDLAPDIITVPLYAAVARAVVATADFGLHIVGPTGAGKSELCALGQQHFGSGMDSRHLPSCWTSTGNSLEALAFLAKDSLLTVDDFAPAGSTADVQHYHREADRVLRAQGNNAGRQRLKSDCSLRPARPPRGLMLSTGEEVPRGQSLRARMLVLELGPSDLNWKLLTSCQQDAARGVYAKALAGFVRWMAPRHNAIHYQLPTRMRELRRQALQSGTHKRTPEIVANLALGLRHWLEYARQANAIGEAEAKAIWRRCWSGLGQAAAVQRNHQKTSEPTRRYLELLNAAIACGRAHVADPTGTCPKHPEAWGWREVIVGNEGITDWRPSGEKVGWLDANHLFLEPAAAYATAQKLARDQGDTLTVDEHTLRRRLAEKGLLVTTSTSTSRETITVRRKLERRRREVLHLSVETFSDSFGTSTTAEEDILDPLSGEEIGSTSGNNPTSTTPTPASASGELVELVELPLRERVAQNSTAGEGPGASSLSAELDLTYLDT